MIKIQLCVTHR